MRPHVRFITLGCRVNQYESEAMRESLAGSGFTEINSGNTGVLPEASKKGVDYVVINTCTVTHGADRENIYWIRRARREHPKAKIVVTGCFIEKNRKQVEEIPEVDLVLENRDKAKIASLLSPSCGTPAMQDDKVKATSRHEFIPLSISRSQDHSRAYIKIQDGCNHACAFCKVVLVRGRSRSREMLDITNEAKRLADSGHREVVLTGIQLGAYGFDLSQPKNLTDAIEACSKVPGIQRIRLSSIEPTDVTPGLIEMMRDNPKCCPHLHIPLQSGDDDVLKGMNRRYLRSYYIELVERLKTTVPDFELTLDVMAGFPDEEEGNFHNTIDLLERVKPLKCHVFPYSKREGTRAFRFDDVPAAAIRDRVKRLIAVADDLAAKVKEPYIGKTVSVLVEQKRGKSAGDLLQGVSANFLKVYFQGGTDQIGQIVPVRLLTLQGPAFLGRVVES